MSARNLGPLELHKQAVTFDHPVRVRLGAQATALMEIFTMKPKKEYCSRRYTHVVGKQQDMQI